MTQLRLQVSYGVPRVGWLDYDSDTGLYSFAYDPAWLAREDAFPLGPRLPLLSAAPVDAALHSAQVRQFFDNLLPEGRALDEAAAANKLSKSNVMGLLAAIGRESAGALRLHLADAPVPKQARHLSPKELVERIHNRADLPFSVWDQKVRLSVAGFQDKLGVLEHDGHWFLVDGDGLASTHLIKPEPVAPALAGLTSNEFLCMRLASAIGLPTAPVRLRLLPDPVLVVERYDRVLRAPSRVTGDPPILPADVEVQRLHIVDGCQALGLPAGYKYERPYGHERDVQGVRDGANYPRLFAFLRQSPTVARDRLALLRWAVFQVLIGNTDAHGKNLSFRVSNAGVQLAPAYDLVSTMALAVAERQLDTHFAMAVGDAFTAADLTAQQWALFAQTCGLNLRQVANELERTTARVQRDLPGVVATALAEGADAATVERVVGYVEQQCARQAAIAPDVVAAGKLPARRIAPSI